MKDPNAQEILSVETGKDEDGSCYSYAIGYPATVGWDEETRTLPNGKPHVVKTCRRVTITAITMQRDVPGLHGFLDRVCVWAGDRLVAEIPRHAADHIGYEVRT